MNSTNVIFNLSDEDDSDILKVDFLESDEDPLEVHLNDESNCQEEMKQVFLALVRLMFDHDINIEFQAAGDYPRTFICEAMKAYVNDLNNELNDVKKEINQKKC